MLTLFIPVIKNETDRLAILLQSLKHFMNPTNMKILILTPKSHLKKVLNVVSKVSKPDVPINFLTDEDIYSYDREKTVGWERQQALKLLVSKNIDTDFYLIFDCDVFATKYFSYEDLIKNNKAIIDLQSSPSIFQDVEEISKMLGCEPIDKNTEVMRVTPAILSTKLARNLLRTLQEKNCGSLSLPEYLYEKIALPKKETNKYVTEYMLYFIYALKSGELWNYHLKSHMVSNHNVWYPEECFEWDPSLVFNENDVGFFCVYQGNFYIPASIVFDQIRDYIGVPRNKNPPKISCLMVTKDRLPLVKTAIKCFKNQTYPNKELVIVCDGNDGVKEYIEKLKDPRIVLFQLQPSSRTLGELRNFSINNSAGELITQWDDDDWYHPSRLNIQYNRLKNMKVDACLLGQWIMAWPGTGKYAVSEMRKDGWEGTMLAKKSVVPMYQNLRKFEDTEMMKRLFGTAKVHIMLEPNYHFLYVYLVHGNNTWDKDHFRVMFDRATPIDQIWSKSVDNLSKKLSELVGMKYEGYTHIQNNNLSDSKTAMLIFLLFIFFGATFILLKE